MFAVSWLFRFNDPNGSFAYLTDDHFFYLIRGWQILFGDIPVRDFVDHGAPLYYYLAAAVQWIGGRGPLSEIVFSVTLISLGAALTFWLAARASGSILLGLAAAAFQIVLAPRFYNYPKILVYTAAIPALWAWIDRPRAGRLAVVALITAVGFLLRHDHGVFVGVAMLAAIVVAPRVPLSRRLVHALVYAAITLAMLLPYLAFIQATAGFGPYMRQASAWAARDRARAPLVFPGLMDFPDGASPETAESGGVARAIGIVRDNGAAWTFYAELAVPIVALLMLAIVSRDARRGWPHAREKVFIVIVLSAALNAGFLRSPLAARLADPSVPHAILLAWMCASIAAMLRRPAVALRPSLARAGRVAAVVAVIPVLSLVGIFATALSKDLWDRLDAATLLEGPGTAFRRAAYMRGVLANAWPLENVAKPEDATPLRLSFYLRACTKPTDRVFMQYYLPQVIGLAERAFAGGHADLRPGFFTTTEAQQLTIERLRRQSVPVVMLETGESLAAFRESFPLITAYLEEHYRPAGERDVDGRYHVHLLVSNSATSTGTYGQLDWPCFR